MKTKTSDQSQNLNRFTRDDEDKYYELLIDKISNHDGFDMAYLDTCIICICPPYSACLCMHTAHKFSSDGNPIEMFFVETPKKGENFRSYEAVFLDQFARYNEYFNNFILVKYDNNQVDEDASDYSWIKQIILEQGVAEKNILTAAVFENKDAKLKTDVNALTYTGESKFWFEKWE